MFSYNVLVLRDGNYVTLYLAVDDTKESALEKAEAKFREYLPFLPDEEIERIVHLGYFTGNGYEVFIVRPSLLPYEGL